MSRSTPAPAPPVGECRVVLDNGFTVVVRENPAAPVVALTLAIGVGSRDERPETSGVTALLGRTLLKGTSRRSALELAQAAEDAGGAIESGTDQEYAEVRARGLARHWRALVELVHEVSTAPSLPPAEIEREREGLVAQVRSLEDEPFQVASRLLARALFGDTGYGLPTAGTPESIGRLTREDLAAHFRTFYTPPRMVLAVSGAVRAAEVAAEVAERFDRLPRGRPDGGEPAAADRPPARRVVEARPSQQVQLLLGYPAPAVGHPDHVPLKVLNSALGTGMSSRLFRRLRDEEGLAYAVGSQYPTRRGRSRLVAYLGTAPANRTGAEAGLRRVVEGLREDPVGADELGRAQISLTGGFALDVRTNARRSFYLAFFELIGVGAGYLERYPALVEAVRAEDVHRAARHHLAEPSVVTVGPP